MDKIKVAILGASGYTGGELVRILAGHPHVSVEYLTAEKHAGRKLGEVFPGFKDIVDLELSPLDPDNIPGDIDVIFLALPHGKSSAVVKEIYAGDVRIVDLGADFRISADNYREWYGVHPCPELIGEAVYGLPELFRQEISETRLVANPGCYPLSAILGIIPALKSGTVDPESIIVDSKSGVTGAGRSPSLDLHFCEVNEGMKAYKIGEHRHTPEIIEILERYSGNNVSLHFTPHLIPINRGILSTIYLKIKVSRDTSHILAEYKEFYSGSPFVRICDEGVFPSTSAVRGSNYCDIGLKVLPDSNTLVVVSVIDNLVRGASGQAVQNMNIMMNIPDDSGLTFSPIFP